MSRRYARWCCGLWLTSLGWATHQRAIVWQSDWALWHYATIQSPRKPRPWVNLGQAEMQIGHFGPAATDFAWSMRLAQNPQRSWSERRYGWAYGETDLAVLAWWMEDHPTACLYLQHVLHNAADFVPAQQLSGQLGCSSP